MHNEILLAQLRTADLRGRADAHRLAARAKTPVELRTRVGWTLVELGLRLASAPGSAAAVA